MIIVWYYFKSQNVTNVPHSIILSFKHLSISFYKRKP